MAKRVVKKKAPYRMPTLEGDVVPIAPQRATAIGTPPPAEVMVTTPEGHPDIVVDFVRPASAILFRAANTFFQTLVGGLVVVGGSEAAGAIIPFATWRSAAAIAVSAAAVTAVQSLVTIFSDLEKRFPLLRA